MKQLRAEGIRKLAETMREDCVQLLRLSRDDAELQKWFQSLTMPLDAAAGRATEIVDNHRGETIERD